MRQRALRSDIGRARGPYPSRDETTDEMRAEQIRVDRLSRTEPVPPPRWSMEAINHVMRRLKRRKAAL